MPDIPLLGVLLGFDGVVCGTDLPVQAFARHCAAAMPVDRGRLLVGGMRGVLERRAELVPDGAPLDDAEDGFDVVEILASAMGLDAATIERARRQARRDLAGSAWAIEPAAGVTDLLDCLGDDARVSVIAHDRAGVPEVLDATELDRRIAADDVLIVSGAGERAAAIRAVVATVGAPERVLVVAARWADLAPAADAGCATALVDRFGRGRGEPGWRATDVAGLVEPVRAWAAATAAVR